MKVKWEQTRFPCGNSVPLIRACLTVNRMKHFSIRHGLWLCLLGAPALVAGVAGCGGGNNVPALPAIPVSVPPFTLQNGQSATLKFKIRGTSLDGTIAIADGAQIEPNSLRRIPPGVYPVNGTFTPPRGYELGGTFGALGPFTARGDLPTTSQTGTYVIAFQGQSLTGILPVLTSPLN